MSFHTGSKISDNLIKLLNISLIEYSAPILDTNGIDIYSEHIIAPFKKEFPNTYQLMQYNMIGTLTKELQVLSTHKFTKSTDADNNGTDNHQTWQEYEAKIEKNLGKINGLSGYKKYPQCPTPDSEQSGYVYITCSDTHEAIKRDETVIDRTIGHYKKFL